MGTFELSNEIVEFAPAGPYNILALSGGGYRGLFTARVLAKIERILGSSLCQHFSLFAGTSVGAIIAAGLALGRPAQDIAQIIENHASEIFDARFRLFGLPLPLNRPAGPFGGLVNSKFQAQALENVLKKVLGSEADIALHNVHRSLIVTSVCATTMSPVVFSNLPPGKYGITEARLKDVLLASCAAPSYFPAFDAENRTFVDGGLIANAPDLLALSEVVAKRIASLSQCRILSVGTAAKDQAVVPSRIGARGLAQWILGDLLPLTLQAQERLILYQTQALLGDNHFRVDAVPSPEHAKVLDLDNASGSASVILNLLAEQTTGGDFPARLLTWFGRRPQ